MATRPVVTLTLIVINVIAYVAELASTDFVARFEMLGQLKTPFGQVIPGYGVAEGEWYRLITAAFLHVPLSQGTFGITHILFNMWALWVLGPQLEQVLGRLRFTVLYLLSALGGNVLLFLVDPGQPALGASGAIFGLFAAFFVVGRRLGVDTRGIAFLIVINLMFTFTFSGISWEGHVGGLITGAVGTRNDAVAESIELIRAEWAKMRDKGVTAAEVKNAKSYLTGSYLTGIGSSSALAGILLAYRLDKRPIDYLETRNSLIEKVTVADVNRVAKRLLKPESLIFVIVGEPQGVTSTVAAPSVAP